MDALTPEDPRRIGAYRLLARLGEGGMGRVYLARSERGRTVAVKTIRSALAQEPDFRRRFAQEIAAARQVGGEWTAPVLDADTDADTPWLATGYIAGPSLHQVVTHDYGPLPERSVLLLAGGLARALRAIHGAGIVHRDLKPSNVLMTIDGPRVIDFGIARALETSTADGLTRTGATVGSPGFMSPEQVRGQRLTPASDIFCLGSLLAFAATGRTPFGVLESGAHVLMFRIAEETPDLTGVSGDLQRLIGRCLAKDPAQRIPVEMLLRYPAPDGSGEPWLPGALLAQLYRDAVSLLDSENPLSSTDTPAVSGPSPGPATSQATSPAPAGPATPTPTPSPTPSPTPAPASPLPLSASPYAQSPTTAYPPPAGGFGEPTPYAPGSPTTPPTPLPVGVQKRSKRRRALVLGLVLALLAVTAGGFVTARLLLSGEDTTPIPQGYLGAWQGEYGERGDSGWRAMRFDVEQGEVGTITGTATTLSQDVLCTYRMRLSSFDQRLEFTEETASAVPESAAQDTCRDNDDVQSMTLGDNGEMTWRYGDQRATLTKAADGRDVVPDSLLGRWIDDWEDDDGSQMRDDVTIEQGSVGDVVLTYSLYDDDSVCTWQNTLVQVSGKRILLGPDELVAEQSDESCDTYESFWAWVDDQGDLRFLWTDDPDAEPYAIYPE